MLLLVLCCGYVLPAQKATYVYRNPKDSTFNCYLKLVPENREVCGLLIRDFSALPDTARKSPYRLTTLALEQGIMVVYTVSTNYFPQLYYDDTGPALLDEMVQEVVEAHKIPEQNIFVGGISASGTRALRYAMYCAQGKSQYHTEIKGVFAVDAPLDLERFYNSVFLHQSYFKEGMALEATWMLKAFPEKMGGTPTEVLDAYRKYSVHSATDTTLGNALYFLNTSVLLFHEPDIDWWLHERGAAYYDINSYDLVGFTRKLKKAGHGYVQLITTSGKGFDRQGKRNCHSWTIVDEPFLLKWIVQRLDTPKN